MKNSKFILPVSKDNLNITRGWLLLGVSSLALAGLFAILLVLARSPYFQAIIPFKDFFHTALIVHVNLSVLVWLLSFISMLCTMVGAKNRIALGFSVMGAIIFSLSPFFGESDPLMNNYVPILQNNMFFLGLGLFGMGITIQIIHTLWKMVQEKSINSGKFAIYSINMITAMAVIAFIWSYKKLSTPELTDLFGAEQYYELLFWGGGHILQITYTQTMLFAWLVLAGSIGITIPDNRIIFCIFIIGLLITIPFPYPYLNHHITDFEYIDFFTKQMQHGGGVSSVILGLFLFFAFLKKKTTSSPEKNALVCSFILFFVGGITGLLISGINTSVPAHYHGSVVGVTLSFMGLTYYLMPKLGYKKISGKMALLQPYLYGGGQFLHIIGLALSGGYGALRKTPGAMETIEGKISMGLMGLGGILSIIGGLFFVIVAFTSIIKSPITAFSKKQH